MTVALARDADEENRAQLKATKVAAKNAAKKARRAAQEAIAELRQQLADEEAARVELGHDHARRFGEMRHEVEQMEERNRLLVSEKDEIAGKREEALLAALQRVKSGVEDLAVRAETMEQAQLQHGKDLAARHAESQNALNAAARHTVTIADAHRRDIDRVGRERECATILSELVERTAAAALEDRLASDAARGAERLDAGLTTLKTEMVSNVIPQSVKAEVGELMTLKLLPLQYSVTDLSHEVKDIETQAETFHDKVTNKLDIIDGTLEAHSTQHQAHTETADKAEAHMKQMDTTMAQQKSAHVARLDEAEMNLREGAAAAALEGMLRSLEATDVQAAQTATYRALGDRVSELGDRQIGRAHV